MTMLVVTHEMQFAREVGTRVLFMDAGRVLEDAPPKAFFTNPQQARAKEFLAPRACHAGGMIVPALSLRVGHRPGGRWPTSNDKVAG